MKFEIKHRCSGEIIYEAEADNFKIALELAIKSFADLRYADLRYADLRSADLSSADVSYAITDKKYISVSGIGRRGRITIYCVQENKIWCGCFIGDLEEFKRNVLETHSENPKYLAEYLSAIEFFEKQKLQEPRAKGEL